MAIGAIPVNAVVFDSFNRTSASGWTTSNSGHVWLDTGSGGTLLTTDHTVDGAGAHHLVPVASGMRFDRITSVSIADVDISATGSVAPSGGTVLGGQIEILGLMFRYTDTTHYYLARVDIGTDQKMTLSLFGYGAASTIMRQKTGLLSNASYTSGQQLTMRVQAFGARIQVKVWATSGTEPAGWDLVMYDTGSLAAGGVGIRTGVGSGNTNTKPVTSSYVQFWAAPMITTALGKAQALRPVVRAAFGSTAGTDPSTWVFTDITKYVRGGVTFSGGAQNQGSDADPAQINLTLSNTDGRFTAKNPTSLYYPGVIRNVPLYVGVTWDGAGEEYELATGFVNGWPIQPNAGLIDVLAPISASGRMRRLRRSSKAVQSALRRSIATNPTTVAYWPLEAQSGQTALSAARDASITGSPSWSGTNNLAGSDTLPSMDANTSIVMSVPTHTFSNNQWQIDWYMCWPNGAPVQPTPIVRINTNGTARTIDIASSSLQTFITLYDNTQTIITNTVGNGTVPTPGVFQHYRVNANDVAGTVTVLLSVADITQGGGVGGGGQSTTSPLGAPTRITVLANASTQGLQIGHFAVYDNYGFTTLDNAALGWAGEFATNRVMRICAENNIPVAVANTTILSQKMGPQPLGTVATILDDCAAMDNGLLHDAGPLGALVYASGASRYNVATSLALDNKRNQIDDNLGTTYDDQTLIGGYKADSPSGGTATYLDPSSPDEQIGQATVNPYTSDQLLQAASWRTNVANIDVHRMPQIGVDLRRSPELAGDVLPVVIPARVVPSNLPLPYPPQGLEQFAEGFSGVVDAVTLKVAYNCTPALPWRIAVIQDATNPWRIDSDTSTMAAGVNSSALSLSVASTGPLWTTTATFPADFPFDINIAGEQMTVTAIAGASSPQTFTVTRSVNGVVKAHVSGETVSLWQPAQIAM